MSKDKISDYSATANSNTDIAGINIDEGCAPSGINNAIRTLMKQLKDWQSGSQDVYITPAGSVSAPAVTTTGDTNTGVYFPAADKIALTTGGTQAVIVDSSQNVGIGTSSPSRKLEVSSNDAQTDLMVSRASNGLGTILRWDNTAGASYLYNNGAYPLLFGTNNTERARIDSSGNVGIGNSSPEGKLDVKVTGAARLLIGYGGGSTNYTDADTQIFRAGNATERMRLDSSGNLLVGTTSGSGARITAANTTDVMRADIAGTGGSNYVSVRTSGSGTMQVLYNVVNGSYVGGIACTTTSTSFGTSSDYRLKENVQPMQGALSMVSQLKPCTYTWKLDGSEGQGFIAHELAEVCPDAVIGEKDAVDADGNPKYQGIDTSFLVATLTAAIQEQQAIIEQLRADVETLKGQA